MSDDPTPPALPDHPELAELRSHLRGQWKAQGRTGERETLREHWLQRDLIGAVTEAMHRGNHVTFTLPGAARLPGASSRSATTTPSCREVTVRLPATDPTGSADPYRGPQVLIEIAEAGKSNVDSRLPPRKAPETFQTVLHQYDFEQQQHPTHTIELGTTFHSHGLLCRLKAPAGDHLIVHDPNGHDVLIAAGAVTYISWARLQR